MKRTLWFSFIFLIGLLSTGCFAANSDMETNDTDGRTAASEKRFSQIEIRDYQGVKLDPSVGPRDNSISGIQEIDIDEYSLKIAGLVDSEVLLTYEDVLGFDSYEKLIVLHCVEGWDATILWKGVLVKDLIDVALADDQANTVIFRSADGYTTSLPLQYIIDKKLILAYSSNNITLPPSLGYPFILVAEDKLGYKWARWVTEIILSDDEEYKGYWEQRGYDNDADI